MPFPPPEPCLAAGGRVGSTRLSGWNLTAGNPQVDSTLRSGYFKLPRNRPAEDSVSGGDRFGDSFHCGRDLLFAVLTGEEEPNPGLRLADGRIEDRPGVDSDFEEPL